MAKHGLIANYRGHCNKTTYHGHFCTLTKKSPSLNNFSESAPNDSVQQIKQCKISPATKNYNNGETDASREATLELPLFEGA